MLRERESRRLLYQFHELLVMTMLLDGGYIRMHINRWRNRNGTGVASAQTESESLRQVHIGLDCLRHGLFRNHHGN